MHGLLKYVLKRGGKGQPAVEGKTGAPQSDDRTWAQIEQVVDREQKRYHKQVVREDGTIVKDYDGPIEGGHGDPRTWGS